MQGLGRVRAAGEGQRAAPTTSRAAGRHGRSVASVAWRRRDNATRACHRAPADCPAPPELSGASTKDVSCPFAPACRFAAASALSLAAPAAFAAHPLQTEDTGTQGAGNVEIENGLSRARFDVDALTVYQPQVSVGLATTVDAIVQPSVVWLHAPGQSATSGARRHQRRRQVALLGQRSVVARDPRRRARAHQPARAWACRTASVSEHALLVATWDDAPTTVHANLGLTRVPRAPGTRATVRRTCRPR